MRAVSRVRQLSVFIENKSGRVSEVTSLLGEAGINIRGFSVSDTADYGILRLVVDRPDEAYTLLREAGFTVKELDVICIDLPDVPGGLAGVLKIVSEAGVNIEYVYSLIATYVVLNVADVDRAVALLKQGQRQMLHVHLAVVHPLQDRIGDLQGLLCSFGKFLRGNHKVTPVSQRQGFPAPGACRPEPVRLA